MNKTLEIPIIAQASERLLRAALDDRCWLDQLEAWATQGLMLVQSNPKAVSKMESEKMQTRINVIMRIAEDAISGEQG